jgi:hypothetical protein
MSRIMKGTNDSRDVDSGNAPTPNAAARRSAAAPGARLQLVDALRCLGLGEVAVGLLAGRARKRLEVRLLRARPDRVSPDRPPRCRT